MSYEIEYPAPIVYTDDQDVLDLAKQYAEQDKNGELTLSVKDVYLRLYAEYTNYVAYSYIKSDPAISRLIAILHEIVYTPINNEKVIIRPIAWW